LGVNSHRLLVRGHRVQYNLDKFDNRDNDINLNKNNLKKFFTLKTFLIISIIIFILFIILIIVKKKNYQINFKK
ncbi:class C sortase, partial [Clostridium perfringens]